jgi:pyruvyltransferase
MISSLHPVTFESLEEVVDAAQRFDAGHDGPPEQEQEGTQEKEQQGSRNTCQIEFAANSNATMAICHYLTLEGNFGDELGPVVVKRMVQLAAPPSCSSSSSMSSIEVLNLAIKEDALKRNQGISSLGYRCLFPLGSVFHMVKNDDHIWGIGINPMRQEKASYPKRFYNHAVRGEKTLSLIRENVPGLESSSVPYGDPGFLIPFLFPEYWKASEPVRSREMQEDRYVCFIPHSHDLPRTYLDLAGITAKKALSENALSSDNKILLISVRQSWRKVLDAISSQCSHVASSSLHGLVEADAMGIPSLWFQWEGSETSETEGVVKYLDYYSSIPATRRFERPTLTELSQITQLSSYPPPMTQDEIWEVVQITLKSFPYDLFQMSGAPAVVADSRGIEELVVNTDHDIPELDLNYHFGWFALAFVVISQSILRKWCKRLNQRQR